MGLQRLALILACLMFVLHTAGEVFHWRAHLIPPTVAVVFSSDLNAAAFTVAATSATPHENCPFCLLNGITASLILAAILITATTAPMCRPTLMAQTVSLTAFRYRRGPPRAPPAFA
jgi:hypothetical protein